jgi:hypothetical protein
LRLSSGQERELTGDREREREGTDRERIRGRETFSLDIDIWGIPMQLRKWCACTGGVEVLWFLTVRISSGVGKEICRWLAKW